MKLCNLQCDPVILFDWKLMEMWRTGVQWWWALDELRAQHRSSLFTFFFFYADLQMRRNPGHAQSSWRKKKNGDTRAENRKSLPIDQQRTAGPLWEEDSRFSSGSLSSDPRIRTLYTHNDCGGYVLSIILSQCLSSILTLAFFQNYSPGLSYMCFAPAVFWPLTLTSITFPKNDEWMNEWRSKHLALTEDEWWKIVSALMFVAELLSE